MTYVTTLLIAGGVLLTVGDIVFKYLAGHHNPLLYAAGLLLYVVGLVFLIETFKYADVQVASALLVLFNIIMLALVGWLYFKETISTLEIVGLIAAGIAIVCLEIGG